jgi:hypothetical protein
MKRAALMVMAVALALPLHAAKVKRLDGDPAPVVVRAAEPTVTIDVKDAEAAEILRSMQKQCGIKNLMIDPGVKGKGTFYLYGVPCRQAFGIVLRSLGFESVIYPNSVVTVGVGKR